MDLSVITATWNNAECIADQIRSVVFACEGLEFEQIIIDNNSKDKTADIVKRFCHSDENQNLSNTEQKQKDIDFRQNDNCIKLITNKKNLGFAKANNQGLKIAQGEYILFLNPDMKLKQGSLKKMIEYLKQNPDIGILSPKLVNLNGEARIGDGPRRFPKWQEILEIFFKLPKIFPKILNRFYYNLPKDKIYPVKSSQSEVGEAEFNRVKTVDSVRGAFMLISKKTIQEVGGWDERYFCWFEDVDLCREVKKIGKKVVYYPEVEAIDLVGQSFKKQNIFWKQWNFFKSAILYFLKWGIN